MKKKLKIAILSRNPKLYSTRRLVEAITARGHEPEVIDYLNCAIVTDMSGPKLYYDGRNLSDLDAVIPRIGASYTLHGSAVVRQLEMMGVIVVNSSISIVRSRDKLRSTQIFANHQVAIPKTVFAYKPKNIDLLIREVGGVPLVIKLLEGTQGIGVVLAETKKAAKSVIEAFYGIEADILIQEFIKEAGGSDIRAFVVNGKVVGAMKRQGLEGEFRSNLHRGGSSSVIKLSAKEKETAINACKAMGLAVAGVDMLRSNRGPLVLEVNSSPGLEGIESATGINIAGKIVEFIENRAVKTPVKDKVGV